MFKPLRALALATLFAVSLLANASVPPTPLSISPSDFIDSPAHDMSRNMLTLHPPEPVFPYNHFTLGSQDDLDQASDSDATLRLRHLPYRRDESEFILGRITSADWLENLGSHIDVDEVERPWSTTTTVHFLSAEAKI